MSWVTQSTWPSSHSTSGSQDLSPCWVVAPTRWAVFVDKLCHSPFQLFITSVTGHPYSCDFSFTSTEPSYLHSCVPFQEFMHWSPTGMTSSGCQTSWRTSRTRLPTFCQGLSWLLRRHCGIHLIWYSSLTWPNVHFMRNQHYPLVCWLACLQSDGFGLALMWPFHPLDSLPQSWPVLSTFTQMIEAPITHYS